MTYVVFFDDVQIDSGLKLERITTQYLAGKNLAEAKRYTFVPE